uniref:Uncharacterized protein n=1 Tax=Strongyloides stercoralis TaxID=6248 RepID=A0A0K0EAX5_STRER
MFHQKTDEELSKLFGIGDPSSIYYNETFIKILQGRMEDENQIWTHITKYMPILVSIIGIITICFLIFCLFKFVKKFFFYLI